MAVALKVCGPSGAIWAPVFMANNAPSTVCGSASGFAIVPIPDPALGIAGGSGVVEGFAVAVGVAVVVVRTAAAGMAVACV